MTAIALLKFSMGQLTVFIVATFRALKPIRPPQSIKGSKALIFCAVLFDKFVQTDTFLELHL